MDLFDRRLLYYLDLNSRERDSVLAKKVRLSKQVVKYRINRLVSEGIIKKFQTNFNFKALGFPLQAYVFFRLFHASKERESELVSYLKMHPNFTYFAFASGEFDLIGLVLGRDVQEIDGFLRELCSKFPEIGSYDLSFRVHSTRFPRAYLIDGKVEGDEVEKIAGIALNSKFDALDLDILKILSKKSRVQTMEISRALGFSFSTVRSRFNSLMEKNLISGFSSLLDLQKIGMQQFRLLVKCDDKSENTISRIQAFAANHKNITWFYKTLGSHDVQLRVEVENIEMLQEVLREFRSSFSKEVKWIKSFAILREYLKEDYSQLINEI